MAFLDADTDSVGIAADISHQNCFDQTRRQVADPLEGGVGRLEGEEIRLSAAVAVPNLVEHFADNVSLT